MDDSPTQPFRRLGADRPSIPIVLSVPHAGRAYSPALLAASRLPRAVIEQLEDRFVDRLTWRAVEAGAGAVIAEAPRAEIDLNRDERELSPMLVEPRPAGGALYESARTRGGFSSPGSEYDVSQETSPRNTSTWKRSSTAWRCNRASSRARRVWEMTSTRMWSSMAGGYPLPR